jgi:hypothetical protein
VHDENGDGADHEQDQRDRDGVPDGQIPPGTAQQFLVGVRAGHRRPSR